MSLERRLRRAEAASSPAPRVTIDEVVAFLSDGTPLTEARVDLVFDIVEPCIKATVRRAGDIKVSHVPCLPIDVLCEIVRIPLADPVPKDLAERASPFERYSSFFRGGRAEAGLRLVVLRGALAWRLCRGDGGLALREELDGWFEDPSRANLEMPDDETMERALDLTAVMHLGFDIPLNADWRTLRPDPVDAAGQRWTLHVPQWCEGRLTDAG